MTLCKCGCGQEVKPGNKFIRGHNKGNVGKKHPKLNINPEITKFVKDNQDKHFCECGCGEIIIIEKRHYNSGIPKFIHGHNRKKGDIIRVCEVCGNEFIAKGNQTQNKKKTCSKKCQYKSVSIKNSQKRVKRTTKICKQCGKEFGVVPCELHQIFCTHKCYTDWYSENLRGENCPAYGFKHSDETKEKIRENSIKQWDDEENRIKMACIKQGINRKDFNGFVRGNRDHVLSVKRCIKLNTKFLGSEAHHIMSGVVIFMPKNIHNYFYHDFKNNKNMKEINKLSWNFLLGDY